MEKGRLDWLRWKMGMPHLLEKPCVGKSGGLAIFWKRGIDVKLTGFMSKYHIDTEITEEDGFVWRFTGTRGEELMGHIDPRVTQPMNELLCKEFTAKEVVEALDSIGDLKAPGPDGMPSIFYKKFWGTVGEKVTQEVLNVLNGGPMPESWNETCVVLIPKVKDPESMTDLRPISLCNVVYKLVSKVLANRLKKILPELISPNQSAFVPGRLITDNILLAYECTHLMKNKRSGLEGYAAVKLDMSKAYDRVEWDFVEKMMRRLGFHERWIKLIMMCISTVKYQFKVNGSCSDVIVPQRGLRQGDPISPYIFLICAEAFSSLLNKAELDGSLQGIKICNNAPSFNHLLFADDSLVLIKASQASAKTLQNILQLYEAWRMLIVPDSLCARVLKAKYYPNTSILEAKPIADNHGGWGFIARDNQSTVRGAGTGHLKAVVSAAQAEAVACMEALHAASDWGILNVIVETDSSILVQAIETSDYDLAPEGVIYRDIRAFIRLNFNLVKVEFRPRGCNKVAHALAAMGANQAHSRQVWLDDVPNSVLALVAGDVAEPVL
ncbi:hypothetical protein QYE76_051736 [Lolium multiflorum]|uniref:Reverse transcriptase domain-containing protein n=1 Tax=Lolium multiflorum TaxID=4521 RepID=A0AAD8WI67_LOLMU|nr:hypothetical protein QYE76_051736 [Lolium multiflorum]